MRGLSTWCEHGSSSVAPSSSACPGCHAAASRKLPGLASALLLLLEAALSWLSPAPAPTCLTCQAMHGSPIQLKPFDITSCAGLYLKMALLATPLSVYVHTWEVGRTLEGLFSSAEVSNSCRDHHIPSVRVALPVVSRWPYRTKTPLQV